MTSKNKKISIVTLLVVLFTCICLAAVNLFAYADDSAGLREYNSKYDKIFEDFDREDISDTVTTTGTVDTGEKPYLTVTFTSDDSGTPDDCIFKIGYDFTQAGIKSIVVEVRAPQGDVTLSELMLGMRYEDSTPVFSKSFSALVDNEGNALTELTSDWTKLVIYLPNSFDEDVYSGTSIPVGNGNFSGFHIYAADGASGTLDIRTVYATTDGSDTVANSRTLLNDFIGGTDVTETKNANAWWCGSSKGYIVKRTVVLSDGGQVNIADSANTSEGYGYAIIEAEGDTANLSVATTTDGTTYGEYSAFTGEVALGSTVCGLSFRYSGTQSVTLQRVFYTNYEEDVAATAIPVIDGETTQKLDDFNVAQSSITNDYDSMAAAEEAINAGLYFRISYNNGDKVSVADGALVLDATNLGSGDYINFKTQTKTAAEGYDYIVLKIKMTGGATLDSFRFGIGLDGNAGSVIWYGSLMSDVGLALEINEAYPYVTEDGWYYAVVNIAESGLGTAGASYDTIDIYYSGTGILYIDEIFFANEAESVITAQQALDTNISVAATDSYVYGGWISGADSSVYNTLTFTVTAGDADVDLSTLRLEFADGTYWFSENAQGTLLDIDGNALVTAIAAGGSVTYYIDISALDATSGIHVHSSVPAAYTITDAGYIAYESQATAHVVDTESKSEIAWTGSYAPSTDGYEYLTYVSADNTSGGYDVLVFTVTATTDTDLSGIRLEFRDSSDAAVGTYWFSANEQGTLLDINGNALVTSISADGSVTYYIDISSIGAFAAFHVHSGGSGTGSFAVSGAYLASYVDYYALSMAALPVYETPDTVKPVVSITNATTATEGEITVTYTVSDDVSAESDITVTISVKDASGNDVTVTNDKFTAAAGVYTVTVTAVDEAGNESSATIQITVSAASGSDDSGESGSGDDTGSDNTGSGDNTGDTDDSSAAAASGCGSLSIGGGIGGGMAGLLIAAFMVAAVFAVRRRRCEK